MDSKQLIEKEYQILCQRRGHLENNLDKIKQELEDLKEQITALDKAASISEQVAKVAEALRETKSE